jgi:hypothetical protein
MMSEDALRRELLERGFHPTDERSDTGTVWSNGKGKWVQVPDSDGGTYPDGMLDDLLEIIGSD